MQFIISNKDNLKFLESNMHWSINETLLIHLLFRSQFYDDKINRIMKKWISLKLGIPSMLKMFLENYVEDGTINIVLKTR